MWLKTIGVVIALCLWTGATAQNFDTSQYAILPFNRSFVYDGTFSKGSIGGTMSNEELKTVLNQFKKCIQNYNRRVHGKPQRKSAQPEYDYSIDLKNYNFQLIVSINSKREKIVWINGFCKPVDKGYHSFDWHSDILRVRDGGKCSFNLKVNLKKNSYFDLTVNGDA